jgi:hypothetical protein
VRDHSGPNSVRASAIALLLAATVLSGCSEKVEASSTLPSTSAAETTKSLPVVGPADFPVPDEARTKDAAGAEAFLRYWIDLLNRQQAIPDGKPLRDLGPECGECQRIAQNLDDAAAEGHRYIGGEIKIERLLEPAQTSGALVLSFIARREPVSIADGDRTVLQERPDAATGLSSGIGLQWSDDTTSWTVTGFNLG